MYESFELIVTIAFFVVAGYAIYSSVKKIKDKKDKKSIIPKVYNDHSLEMKDKKETIQGFIYFNQADAAWNSSNIRAPYRWPEHSQKLCAS